MDRKFKVTCIKILIGYILIAAVFKWLAGDPFRYKEEVFEQYEVTSAIGPIIPGEEVYQEFQVTADKLSKISLCFGNYGPNAQGTFRVKLTNLTENIAYPTFTFSTPVMNAGMWCEIVFPEDIENAFGKRFSIDLICEEQGENPLAIYRTDNQRNPENLLKINKKNTVGELASIITGKVQYPLYPLYWTIATVIGFLLVFYLYYTAKCKALGKRNIYITIETIWQRYNFLIRQLVSRDFKNKYKRSVLGYMWSFLNPLATMCVQYIVFSTIFKNDIKNFPVYLLAGTVFFSFFTDSVGQGQTAIVGNASLITKVYVPKYIYPITKVCSTSINLLISLIPLLILSLITGAPLNETVFLLVIPIAAILIFSMGMSLLLASSMVFFRDTQYLWGIISLVWMYATPLFYPVTILPEEVRSILYFNPIYHIVTFVRTILIDGLAPEPWLYISCIIGPLLSLIIGSYVFKKCQDKFVLYI